MKSKLLFCLGLMQLFLLQNCKFPKDKLEDFKVNLDGNFVNTLIKINVITEDSLPVNKIALSLSGKDADKFFDIEGKTNYNAEGGNLDLILAPGYEPTYKNPLVFTIQAEKQGYLPLKKEIFVFSNSQKFTVDLTFKRPNALPVGTTFKSNTLDFLGKRKIDTIDFYFQRTDGVTINYRFPTAGLVFIKKSAIKFRSETNTFSIADLLEDSSVYSRDSGYNQYPFLSDLVYKNNANKNEKLINGSILTPTSKTLTMKTRVGYRKSDLLEITEDRLVFDTALTKVVKVEAISESNFLEYGFINEQGVLSTEFTSFQNAIGIPQLMFFDNKTNNPIIPYYPGGNGGAIVEVILPSNNYNLFYNGIGYSTSKNTYFETKRCIQLNPNCFTTDGLGTYKLLFTEEMMNGRYFLYNNKESVCGYAQVNLMYPNIPNNLGFNGSITLKNKHYNLTYTLNFTEPNFILNTPSFPSDPTDFIFTLNHPLNACSGTNTNLYSEIIQTADLCNFTQSPLYISASFNPSTTLTTISSFVPLRAKALINCAKGNYVVPPAISLSIWQLGCKGEANITIENGEFFSPFFIEKNKTYVVKYEKLSSTGSPVRVYDTLYFDDTIANQPIVDNKYGYWVGTLQYHPIEGFKLDIFFDNRKLKYNIPSCN